MTPRAALKTAVSRLQEVPTSKELRLGRSSLRKGNVKNLERNKKIKKEVNQRVRKKGNKKALKGAQASLKCNLKKGNEEPCYLRSV
mmetsp:Transcript_33057/g.53437  ORF Transcript_33057/g.53437 Transcript_33057/m.53437 type:complete len:86 (+) Transcript_33057:103-360(+)